jgi:hypothetical protein
MLVLSITRMSQELKLQFSAETADMLADPAAPALSDTAASSENEGARQRNAGSPPPPEPAANAPAAGGPRPQQAKAPVYRVLDEWVQQRCTLPLDFDWTAGVPDVLKAPLGDAEGNQVLAQPGWHLGRVAGLCLGDDGNHISVRMEINFPKRDGESTHKITLLVPAHDIHYVLRITGAAPPTDRRVNPSGGETWVHPPVGLNLRVQVVPGQEGSSGDDMQVHALQDSNRRLPPLCMAGRVSTALPVWSDEAWHVVVDQHPNPGLFTSGRQLWVPFYGIHLDGLAVDAGVPMGWRPQPGTLLSVQISTNQRGDWVGSSACRAMWAGHRAPIPLIEFPLRVREQRIRAADRYNQQKGPGAKRHKGQQ